MSAQYGNLLDAIGVAPALPGARCRGRHHLFDARGPDEPPETAAARHRQAIGLCCLCPSLADCTAWVDGLTPSKRPVGVVAGQITQPRPASRPRTESA